MLRLAPAALLAAAATLAAGCTRTPAAPVKPADPIEFAGAWGERGDGPGQLSLPLAIAADAGGNVYIADAATHLIHKFNAQGEPLLAFADARLKDPEGLAVDRGGAIYVADARANRVHIYFPEGEHLRDLYGGPRMRFEAPAGVAVDDDGNIYVADAGGSRIQQFSASGRFPKAWWERASAPVSGSAAAPGLAVAPDGFLYLADPRRPGIRKFSRQLEQVTAWGEPGEAPGKFLELGGLAVAGQFAILTDAGKRAISVWTFDGRHVLDYDLSDRLSAPALPPARPAAHSTPAKNPAVDPHLRLPVALSGHDLLLVLDPAAPRVLRFRLRL